MRKALFTSLFVLLATVSVFAFPTNTGLVTDVANMLTVAQKGQLETQLRTLETNTSVELAVVTVPNMEGMDIDTYKVKLFEAWGIGKKGKDNGILLVVAPTERKVGIEVGYGLEAIIPDGMAGSIIRNQVVPGLRSSDRANGIFAGVKGVTDAIIAAKTRAPEATVMPTAKIVAEDNTWQYVVGALLGLGILVGILIYIYHDAEPEPERHTYIPDYNYPATPRRTTNIIAPVIVNTSYERPYSSPSSYTPSSDYGSSSSSGSNYDSSSSSSSFDFGGGSSGGGGASDSW